MNEQARPGAHASHVAADEAQAELAVAQTAAQDPADVTDSVLRAAKGGGARVRGGRHEGAKGLGQRAARGTFVTLLGQGGSLVVQMASVVILARLLDPTAYGLVAMVLAVVGVAHIFRDFGLSSAAVQAPTLSWAQRNNLFWLNTGIGVVLTAIVCIGAPIVQAVYHADHLAAITRVLALTFLLNGAATQFRADLNRRMDFLRLAIADIFSAIVALGVATFMALRGAGYWALVAQQLIQGGVMLILVIIFAGWIPRRWSRGTPVKSLITFGWQYVGAQLINYVANNADSFVIGYCFGANAAGVYNRAFQLLARPLAQLRSPSITVALPTLAKLQDEYRRFEQYLLTGQVVLCYPIAILMGVIAGASDPIVRVVLGEEWLSAEPILRFLAIAGVFQTLGFVCFWVYLAKGITDELRRYTLISAAIRVACVLGGLHWGVVGVAAGYGIGPALAWPLGTWWLSRRVGIPTGRILIGGIRITIVGGLVTVVSWLACLATTQIPAALQLMIATGSSVAVCIAVAIAIPWYRSDGMQIVGVVKKALPGGSRPRD